MINTYPKTNLNGKNGHHNPKLIYAGLDGVLFQGDCSLLLKEMLSDSIDLIFADPPFNLGKDYGTSDFSDQLVNEQYQKWCQAWLWEMIRILKPGGSLFLYHWPKWLIELGHWLNSIPTLEYRSWIALKMKSGFPIQNRLHPAHYGLLYYTKNGAEHTFNVVRHKAPTCRHCHKEIRDYGGYREKFEKYEDESGTPWIQISDFWEDTRPERSAKSREEAIMELPMHIPERAILIGSNPGDVILDVFGGGGSTYHAAQYHDRKWIGCDVADVTPILRRLKTCFGLKTSIKGNPLFTKFKRDFRISSIEWFRQQRGQERIDSVESFEGKASSFNENASKSKVLGY